MLKEGADNWPSFSQYGPWFQIFVSFLAKWIEANQQKNKNFAGLGCFSMAKKTVLLALSSFFLLDLLPSK